MLKWFQRLIAVIYGFGALVHVGNLLGFGPDIPPQRAGAYATFDVCFLVLDIAVVVGLLFRRRWGIWAFFAAAGSQLVMYSAFGDYFAPTGAMRAQLNGLLVFHVVTVAVMAILELVSRDGNGKRLIRRYPASSFLVGAFSFTSMAWIPAIVAGGVDQLPEVWQLPQQVIPAFGPLLAAMLVTSISGGAGALRNWLQTRLRVKDSIRWILIAAGLAAGITSASLLIQRATTADSLGVALPSLPTILLVGALMTLFGGGQEEPGWRGFALERFESRFGMFGATMVIAVIWAAWHAPLWFVPDSPQAAMSPGLYLLHLVPYSMIFTWLWHRSSGSVPVAMVFHGLNNALALVLLIEPAGTAAFSSFMPYLIAVEWPIAIALGASLAIRSVRTSSPLPASAPATELTTNRGKI